MDCINHETAEAVDRCAGCAEPYCKNCLVDLSGIQYCMDCKYMAVVEPPAVEVEPTLRLKEADDALKYALIGIFCFGIILGPMAIAKANEAKKVIQEDPRYKGAGKVNAAYIIGGMVIFFWVVGVITRIQGF